MNMPMRSITFLIGLTLVLVGWSAYALSDPTLISLSDATREGLGSVTHAYSSVNPFNSDSTLVLLEKSGGIVHVRDLKGRIVRDNLHEVGILPTGEPVWSRTDPNFIYFHTVDGNELKRYDIQSHAVFSVAVFPEFTTISFGLGEGDLSDDGDHLAILADRRYGFIYTISTGHKTKYVDLTQYGSPDSFDMSGSNGAVLLTYDPGSIIVLDQNMDFRKKVADFGGHSDRARWRNEDYVVLTNSADPTPIDNCPNGIVRISLESGQEACVITFDWSLAVHVSCNNAGQGWCLVSTYRPAGPDASVPYANQLLKVPLDGSAPTLIAPSKSTASDYARFPRAAVSGNGNAVLFDSDTGGPTVNAYLASIQFSPSPLETGRPVPTHFFLTEGSLISAANSSDPDIYIISQHGFKRLFLNPVIFGFYGHLEGFQNVKMVSSATRDAFETTTLFRNCETRDPKVYALEVTGEDTGTLHHLNIDGNAAVSQDPEFFKKIFCINNNEYHWYAKGNPYTSLGEVKGYIRQP